MKQHGLGLAKDFHLAKRYYDMSQASSTEAFWPAKVALWKLRAHRGLLECALGWADVHTPDVAG